MLDCLLHSPPFWKLEDTVETEAKNPVGENRLVVTVFILMCLSRSEKIGKTHIHSMQIGHSCVILLYLVPLMRLNFEGLLF